METSHEKKLELNKETIRNLQDADLASIAGGLNLKTIAVTDGTCPGGTGPCPTNTKIVFNQTILQQTVLVRGF